MKILKAEVINYKSLGKAVVEFGNLTIFIGKNSHGKSNFIEALYLFFNEFEPRIQNNVNNIPKELWTGKEIDNPIKITLTFKLTKREFNNILDKEMKDFFKINGEDGDKI